MEFRLLGPLEALDGGNPISLGGPKQRTVLAHLLLRSEQLVPAERLIDEVWGEEPPNTARNALQTYVSHLRKALGRDRLEGRSGGYVLHVEPSEVDAFRFEALVERARKLGPTDAAGAVRDYGEALTLWRAPALDDLAGQPSLRPGITRLEELRMAATEERVAAELDLGRHAELIPEMETLTARHPLRERLWGHLMTALYRSGRQGDALAAFQKAREVLAEELGIDPSPELQRLHEQILKQDRALEIAGEPLRGYRLLEQVGEGAFGAVHRAYQPQVGREVAVKVIHPRLANNPEFIRRFEAEAQLVARLEHPHVVPLYDYWREPDGAYLVMRFLRGGSLQEALRQGPLAPETAVGVLDHVAQALASAHRQGVVHRDVKPANILFDEEGNTYLSDFGIAKQLAAAKGSVGGGTPSPFAYYLSPEEVRGETPSSRADIYSLGLVLFEMLAGRHPYAGSPPRALPEKHLREPVPSLRSTRADIPSAVDRIIERATAKDPEERFTDARALASALRAALGVAAAAVSVPAVEVRNPYKGLRPFLEADAADFFGREDLVERLVDRMAEGGEGSRLLAVVGPSGSGKSSLLRGGLVPALRRGAVQGSEGWFVAQMVPGDHPFAELESALLRVAAQPPPPDLLDQIEGDQDGLIRAAGWVLPNDPSELLLVIDQFEELFTLVDDEETRARFLASVVAAATDPRSRIRLIITIRADFYDRPLLHRTLAELVRARTEVVVPLTPEELERAVTIPAERVGVAIGPGLVAQLVADVADQPGALPLLQYALTELFDRRQDSALSPATYREIGGVTGALARRAEEVLASLSDGAREAARQLFLRLVTPGEGTEDTRRRVLQAELTSLNANPAEMEAAIVAFGEARLLSFDRDPDTRGPTVEVAHEALLREWGRLRGWIDAVREDLRTERRLAPASRDWSESGRDPSFLLRGAHLARFEAWAATSGLALTGDERAFLEASLARRDIERGEEKARAERERALERRSWRRLRALVAVLAAAALVASGLTAFAFTQRERAQREAARAEQEARIATARELAAAAVANLDVDPERSILLALEALNVTWEADRMALPEAEEALHRALQRSRVLLTVPQSGGLDVSADGTRFGTTGEDGTATVWETETGERLLTLRGHDGAIKDIAFSPDGSRLATTGSDGTVRLWDGASGRQIYVLQGPWGVVLSTAFSPDGRRLATTGEDATVRIWDVAAGTEEMVLTGPKDEPFDVFFPVSPVFSPDGSRLASGGWGTKATIWDLATGKIAMVLTGHVWGVTSVAFSPDGRRVATAASDSTARLWDARTGQHLTTFSGHVGDVYALDYSPDGSRIATGGGDGTGRVWDTASGQQLMTLAGHTIGVEQVVFTPDGDRVLTAGLDGTTRLWDVSVGGGRDWLTVPGPYKRIAGVAFSPDGTRFAVPGQLTGVTIRDVDTGAELVTLERHNATITRMAFSPDGTRLAAAAGSGARVSKANHTVPIWDVDTGELVMTLTGHTGDVTAVAFSPNGRRLVTSSVDGTLRVWDAATGEQQRALRVGAEAWALGFSSDGRFLLAGIGCEGSVTVWDAATLERQRELRGHTDCAQDVAFGPDERAVTASWDGTAKIWDLATGRELATLRGHTGAVLGVAVSPDGEIIATASHDGTAKLWDTATGREVLTLYGHELIVHSVAFSPDGRLVATASADGTVALHLLPIDEFVELAHDRVTRSLTDEECRQYLRLETCP